MDLSQFPPLTILIFISFPLMFFGSLIYMALQGTGGRKRKELDAPSSKSKQASTANTQPASAYEDHHLPELDLLTDLSNLVSVKSASEFKMIDNTVYRLKTSTGNSLQAKEVLSVLRDESDGRLVVLMGETAYRSLNDTPAVKKQFLELMKELSASINKAEEVPVIPEKPTVPAIPNPTPEPVTPIPPPIKPPQPNPKPIRPDTPPPPARRELSHKPEGTIPGMLPKYDLDSYRGETKGKDRLGRIKVDYLPVPEFNIAKAIEEFLQHKLADHDDYAGREIHVHEAPGGGVRIQVDEQYFESVDEIADAEIRAYIRATIEEWQEHH